MAAYTPLPLNCVTGYSDNCTGGNLWAQWPVLYNTSSGHVTVTGGNIIWNCWNQLYTGNVTTTGSAVVTYVDAQVWGEWNREWAPNVIVRPDARAIVAADEWKKRQKEAEVRAEELLMIHLSEAQRQDYKAKGYFETEVNDKRYRLYKGSHGNLRQLDKVGKEIARLCVNAPGVPHPDNVLAQLLALHADEAALLRAANITPLA